MLNKKFLLSVLLCTALSLSSCYNDDIEITETTTAATTTAATTVPTETTTTETTTTYDTGNPEEGLVFFVQPIIKQYDEYTDWQLADWECRDSEVKRGWHYDNEWYYSKELIFAFSNYTDEPVTVDSIQIFEQYSYKPIKFTDGSDSLNIDFTVQPKHKTDYLLQIEDFDYTACESGIYTAVANFGFEQYSMQFFIDNSELYTEQYFTKNWFDPNKDFSEPIQYAVHAPTFLTEEQQKIFAQAYGLMVEFFWCSAYLSEEYAESHTAEDFIGLFTDVFTEEYAKWLAQGRYIDENGELMPCGGDRGSDISYQGHCFMPVLADEYQITFKAVVIHAHEDNPYDVTFEETEYQMVNTKDGWRVFRFELWN
ncbi:MAG: hypothetical protein NC253_04640 [Ruminococcus sp.]|nr:hypothetical protein [Ruminococcus sp.]MCM1381538.1 hypothetical protein [Muribaculaceae bacterium]MCM1478790.1 hypothetical protein [Muribaculaceae bacterium]